MRLVLSLPWDALTDLSPFYLLRVRDASPELSYLYGVAPQADTPEVIAFFRGEGAAAGARALLRHIQGALEAGDRVYNARGLAGICGATEELLDAAGFPKEGPAEKPPPGRAPGDRPKVVIGGPAS